VDRLGYFTDIDIQTQEVADSPDQVDLVVDVKEKPTGSLQLGAGFSTSDSVTVTFGITQENVFGSGNYLGLSVSLGSYSKAISLSATDPYFTRDGISRTVSAFYSTSRPYYDVDGNYELVHEGASIKFGVPFNAIASSSASAWRSTTSTPAPTAPPRRSMARPTTPACRSPMATTSVAAVTPAAAWSRTARRRASGAFR
jgi:outer membrane protein assembly factor BamA